MKSMEQERYLEILEKRKQQRLNAVHEEQKRLDEDDKNFQYFGKDGAAADQGSTWDV
jgi:hypothetical protein